MQLVPINKETMRPEMEEDNKLSFNLSKSSTKPTRGSKRTRLVAPEMPSAGALDKAYRLHFSCENKGRYFRSSKRKIRWYVPHFPTGTTPVMVTSLPSVALLLLAHRAVLVYSFVSCVLGGNGQFWLAFNCRGGQFYRQRLEST